MVVADTLLSGAMGSVPKGARESAVHVTAERLVGLDSVRAVAALGIIWLHSGRSAAWEASQLGDLGRWGSSFLNLIAGFFLVVTLARWCARNAGTGVGRYALHRIARLGAPFVIWSLIYLASRYANYFLFGKVTSLSIDWTILVYGTTYHLWFLPYLIAISLLTLPLAAWAIQSVARCRVAAGIAIACALCVIVLPTPSWLPERGSVESLATSVYSRSPSFLFGLALGLLHLSNVRFRVSTLMAGILGGTALFAAGCATVSPNHELTMVWCRVTAICAFVLGMGLWSRHDSGALVQWLGRLGQLGFGVYLCHVLFLEGALAAASALHIPATILRDIGVFAVTVPASFGLAWMMRHTVFGRWLAP